MTEPAPRPRRPGRSRPEPLAGARAWPRGVGRRVGLLGLAAALALPQGAAGQEDGPPGIRLTFGVSERLEANTNLGLDPDGEDPTYQAVTNLGFGLVSRTPISVLELGADARLRLAEGPGVDDTVTFDGPVLSFDYEREVPSASFAVDGSLRQDDVTFLRDLSEFVTDEGVLELPEDFEDFEGDGTRRSADIDAALSLRDDRPFGVTVSAGLTVVDYRDVTAADLVDSTRTRFGAELRFDLTPVAQVRVGVGNSVYEEDGDDERVTRSLDVTGTIDRPRGPISARLALDDTEDGLRTAVSFGRSLALPTGGLSASLGATRAAEGGVSLTGDLSFNRELPQGEITLSLAQAVVNGDEDQEELVTRVAAGYRRDLTPVASLNLDALYSGRRDTETDATDQALEVGASVGYQVTRDWGLRVGYRHRLRDEAGEDRANSDTVFLTIGRTFERGL